MEIQATGTINKEEKKKIGKVIGKTGNSNTSRGKKKNRREKMIIGEIINKEVIHKELMKQNGGRC